MVGGPVETMIGVSCLGIGSIMMYAAAKNVSVFGTGGLLSTAISTGTIPNSADAPKLFGPIFGDTTSTVTRVIPQAVKDSLNSIATKDPGLSTSLSTMLGTLGTDSTAGEWAHFSGLILLAKSEGFIQPAQTIEDYAGTLQAAPPTVPHGRFV
jgi:hypothetical protein